MSYYKNYNNAKFILFTSKQYEEDNLYAPNYLDSKYDDAKDKRSVLQLLMESGANGYVIMPTTKREPLYLFDNSKNPISDYTVEYMSADKKHKLMSDCISEIKKFVKKILEINPDANLWIGTPTMNVSNYPGSIGISQVYIRTMMEFLVETKKALSLYYKDDGNSAWDNVKGFFYNQETIYSNQDIDVNNLTNHPETFLMKHVCDYIHNSVPRYAPDAISTDMGWEETPINRDIIWVPYLSARPGDNEQDLITKTYKDVATLVENTALFDCAFIQAFLIHQYDNGLTPQEVKTIRSNGSKNISAICHAVENGEFVYNDLKTVVIPQEDKQRTCIIGAEYEISGIHEFNQENGPDCDINYKESAFLPYCKYDKFIGKKPLLFYWDGDSDYAGYKVSQVITTKYSGLQGPGLYKNINSNYKKFSDALFDTEMQTYMNSLENALADSETENVSISVSASLIKKEVADFYAYSMKTVFLMDNPDKYWIDDLEYTIEYDGDYVSKINFTVINSEERGGNINPLVEKFLNTLNIDTGDVSAYSADYTDDISKFIKIHDKLITDGTYIETTENVNYNCAYGLLWRNAKKGNSRAFAAALSLLCNSAGIPCLMMEGLKDGKEHYWNYVLLGGEWWFVDAALNVPTDTDGYKYKYFLRTKPSSYFDSVFLPEVNSAQGSLVKYGDVDQDGAITSNDLALAQQLAMSSSFEVSPLGLIAADVDGDGYITFNDASEILSKTLNNSFVFSVEEKINNQWT